MRRSESSGNDTGAEKPLIDLSVRPEMEIFAKRLRRSEAMSAEIRSRKHVTRRALDDAWDAWAAWGTQ